MPVQIGAKRESAFDNPIGLLTDCHRRIENFLAVLLRLGEQARGMPLDSEQRTSLETALGYFRESAPKHTADEEDSLFPRLRSIERADVQRALASIEALESDHAAAALRHAELDELGRRWLDSGSLNAPDASRFNAVARELDALYQAHIAVEEREVFPLASSAIDGDQRLSIGREMAARRGLRKDS
jgi:hemerythrin-like domain-containing protein